MITEIYRKCLPAFFRQKVYSLFLGSLLELLRKWRFYFYCKIVVWVAVLIKKNEKINAYVFMNKYGLTMYPGRYSLDYREIEPAVLSDEKLGLFFVLHNEKKLYFPASFTKEKVIEVYRRLLIEQDPQSPHRYLSMDISLEGYTLLDIGGAEGIFSLDAIDYVDQVYLFECEDEWIPALKATFDPWMDKVCIIRMFVGREDSESTLTIDSFMEQRSSPAKLFIKMDIEGSEMQALLGARKTFAEYSSRLKFAICVYHANHDKENISSYLADYGYEYEYTKGFLFVSWALRTAVVRSMN